VLLVTTSDVTKRLESELQLIQAGKMATLGEMATGVAHELNQPLAVIKTASSFFMKKINKGEKIKDDILLTMSQEIDSHVNRASNIINHMRQFGRKSDIIALEKVQINDIIRSAVEIFSQQLKLREIEVTWDLERNLAPIMAEKSRMEQVFINLLINARDAIEKKWESKNANNLEVKNIHLKTFSSKDKVCVAIKDTGIGIPKSIKDKIFEPFFTTKKIGKGTGIGLSISYGIVKDFHGDIRFKSKKNLGTTFIITFPRNDST